MTCGTCGSSNPPGQKFCGECGSPLATGCPACGFQNSPGQKFCGECGTRLGGGSSGPVPGVGGTAATSSGWVGGGQPASGPAAAAEVALPSAERRLVTVLFADLVGFTTFAEGRDPEAVRETLTRYFEMGRDIIGRYGGTVEKFIGDAVMAVWGTPVAHEDDAERAVRAALELTDAIPSLGPGISARAGVLTGEAAVTLGATGQGMVAGDMVNTAARLQSAAPPGGVLVGEATMRAASAAIAFEPAGEQQLKGKQAPVAAFLALRVVAQRGGAGRSDLPEPPFVGRDEELRILKDALHLSSRDPRTRLLSVTGPAGIGKSRLAWEFLKYVDGLVETVYWHAGRCPSYGEGISFWALGEMVRSRARLSEADGEATTRARIRETLGEHVPDEQERAWIEPALLALLGLEPAPPGGREMLFAAWRTFFERIAAGGTTVLAFEDLHWADPGLLDFIDHVLDWSKGAPILIVTLARPELFDRRPDWGAGRRTFTAVALDPLPEAAMRRLLLGLVPGLPEVAVAAIVERADGIPLYAVETVRMLLADGRLERTPDGFRPTADLDATRLAVPESLRSLIASRLDALEAGDRGLLQDASILGQSFTLEAIAAVSGAPQTELEPRLRALVRRELLTLDLDPRSPERGQYAFVQALIREVAYGTLARRDRRARHLAAARFFETLGEDELAGILASHYLAAHEASAEGAEADAVAAQARLALRGAAERAAALGGHEQAATYLGQAVAVTVAPPDRAPLLERRVEELTTAGRYEEAEADAREAITLREGLGDPAATARVRALLGAVHIAGGHIPEAIDALERALGELPEEGEAEARAEVLARLGRAYYRDLRAERSLETTDRALALAERLGLRPVIAEALISKGTALTMLARYFESIALLRSGLELARREGLVSECLRAHNNLANVVVYEDGAEGYRVASAGLELARTVGDLGMAVWMQVNVGWQCWFAGMPIAPVMASMDELLAQRLDDADRSHVLGPYLAMAYASGRDTSQIRDEIARADASLDDPQTRATRHGVEIWGAFLRGDTDAARREGLAQHALRPDLWGADTAAIMAAWDRDAELVRRIQAEAVRAQSSAYARGFSAAIEGALAILDGRPDDGLVKVRTARRILHDQGDRWDAALVGLLCLRLLGPDSREAVDLGQSALETYEQMGADAMAAIARQELQAGGGVASAQAAPATRAAGAPSGAGEGTRT